MAIKSFMVRSESINGAAGALNYATYLKDEDHPNHEGRTSCIRLLNNPTEIALKAVQDGASIDLRNKTTKRGGRPIDSYLQSFMFSPPASANLSKEDWKKMAVVLLKDLSLKLDIPMETLKDNVSVYLHNQDNAHLNIIVNRNVNQISRTRILTRPSTTQLLKKSFNAEMLKHGYDVNTYIPTDEKPEYTTRFTHLIKRENDLKSEQQKLVDEQKELNRDIKVLVGVEKLQDKLFKQFEKLIDYYEASNQKRAKSTKKRIEKTLKEIDAVEVAELMKVEKLILVGGVNDAIKDFNERTCEELRVEPLAKPKPKTFKPS
jgi:predicted transcriptional regulator